MRFAGVVPTPAVAWLAKELGADAGVVVSASHNPWTDNGVKIFSGEGRKLPDEVELEIERHIDEAAPAPPRPPSSSRTSAARTSRTSRGTLPHRLDGLKVVIDAANGAAFEVAPAAFRAAGAAVIARNVSPGRPEHQRELRRAPPRGDAPRRPSRESADLGIALDGDADRIIVADDEGTLLDGDDVLFLWTLEMEREGRKPAAVVGTVMSNWGLEKALEDRGVVLVRAAVGDRYVVEEMEKTRRAPRRRAVRPPHPRGPHDDGRRHADGPPPRGARRGLRKEALGPAPLRPHAAGPREREGQGARPVRRDSRASRDALRAAEAPMSGNGRHPPALFGDGGARPRHGRGRGRGARRRRRLGSRRRRSGARLGA